jgi:hypothetical protein
MFAAAGLSKVGIAGVILTMKEQIDATGGS